MHFELFNVKNIDVVIGILTRGSRDGRCRLIHWTLAASLHCLVDVFAWPEFVHFVTQPTNLCTRLLNHKSNLKPIRD